MSRVAIVDYGMSNTDSVYRAVEEVGGTPYVVDRGSELKAPDHIILPGVGSFEKAMGNLRSRDLVDALEQEVRGSGIPLLGICLGMQLLAKRGQEGGQSEGLGWIDASVVRLEPTSTDRRIPHMGWNEVDVDDDDGPLFNGIPTATDFYFVHSYHMVTSTPVDVLATTPYCGGFTSAVRHGPTFGVQFHPEKSQRAGFALLRNFLAI